MRSDSFVSVAVVVENGLSTFASGLRSLHAVLDLNYNDYEIVIILPGPARAFSRADSVLLEELSSIRVVQLSTSVSADVASGAGLENSIGDFVVLMDSVCDPASVVPGLVETCRSGADVVIGTSRRKRSIPYWLFRKFAGWVLEAVDYELPRDATGLRCLSRRAVNAVTSTGRFHHQLHMRIQKTGYGSKEFPYSLSVRVPPKRFLGGARSLAHLIVFNSSKPLRWMSSLGILGSLLAMFFGLYSVIVHTLSDNVVQGWTTNVLFLSTLFLIQFVMLAFFGEYLGRLLEEHGGQGDYSVVSESHSTIMVNADRVNVLLDSTTRTPSMVQTGRDR